MRVFDAVKVLHYLILFLIILVEQHIITEMSIENQKILQLVKFKDQ